MHARQPSSLSSFSLPPAVLSLHGVGREVPSIQKWPGGQLRHWLLAFSPNPAAKRPGWHGVGEADPAPQKCPLVQTVGTSHKQQRARSALRWKVLGGGGTTRGGEWRTARN